MLARSFALLCSVLLLPCFSESALWAAHGTMSEQHLRFAQIAGRVDAAKEAFRAKEPRRACWALDFPELHGNWDGSDWPAGLRYRVLGQVAHGAQLLVEHYEARERAQLVRHYRQRRRELIARQRQKQGAQRNIVRPNEGRHRSWFSGAARDRSASNGRAASFGTVRLLEERRRVRSRFLETYSPVIDGSIERKWQLVLKNYRTAWGAFDVAFIRRLLDDGAPVDATFAGQSLLHRAAAAGDQEVMSLLLIKGADRRLLDSKGRTPFECAIESGHRLLALPLENLAH